MTRTKKLRLRPVRGVSLRGKTVSKIEWLATFPRWWLFCAGLRLHRGLPKGLAGEWALDPAAWASVPFVRMEIEETARLLDGREHNEFPRGSA